MKRFLFSTLVILVSLGTLAATAQAEQFGPKDEAADINGNDEVTLHELHNFNRDQRDGYHKGPTATVAHQSLDEATDINGNEVLTLHERHNFNRDQRDGYHKGPAATVAHQSLDEATDTNGNDEVTLDERHNFNRDQRDGY
ncbi:hypothetical protein [Halomicronema sp. CCY15110]|uniref:hypothetical protein n=1 Tax=Halomicronema sp. CCY15110 TaxID=2767773 RepID=UPI00194FCE9B|nr:hypothetical protein [Halomicronema sp. CCY15110]